MIFTMKIMKGMKGNHLTTELTESSASMVNPVSGAP